MTRERRKLLLALVFVGACAALALTLGRSSSTSSAVKAGLAAKNAPAIGRIRESIREQDLAEGTNIDPDSAAGEALAARAYPGTEVTLSERQSAIAAGTNVAKRGPKHPFKWDSSGRRRWTSTGSAPRPTSAAPSGPAA
jgi:predicted transcriptional regulator